MARRVCLLLGYACGVLSLCMPAVEFWGESLYGYECLMYSIGYQVDMGRHLAGAIWRQRAWPELSGRDTAILTAGCGNFLLMIGWIPLLLPSRVLRAGIAIGEASAFGFVIYLWAHWYDGVYIGFYFWGAAFGLAATGMLLSAKALKRGQP